MAPHPFAEAHFHSSFTTFRIRGMGDDQFFVSLQALHGFAETHFPCAIATLRIRGMGDDQFFVSLQEIYVVY